jgi:hypothetical protein
VASLLLVDATDLPTVDRTTPPLDDGRVTVSLPEDWTWAPRSKDYLVRAQMSRDARYPNVTVYAEAAPEMEDASSENAKKLAETFRATLDKELAPRGLKLEEPVHAIQIGDFFGVEYVRLAKIGADSVERLFLVTVKNSRKYTLELRTLQGSLPRFRPFGRAIAASMEFNPDEQAVGAASAP